MKCRTPHGISHPERFRRCRSAEHPRGFVVPIMLIAAFLLVLGAITLMNRAMALRTANGLQDQAREALDAADSGIEATIAELNRDENRMLAASKVTPTAWEPGTVSLRNPCYNNAATAITNEARDLGDGQWRTLADNPNLRYRIRSLEVKNARRSERLRTDLPNPGGSGATISATGSYSPEKFELETDPQQQYNRLQIAVHGQSLRNNTPVANVVVTTELGVVPKCCDVSIGEDASSATNLCSTRFPRILVGLNGGGVRQAGSMSQLRQQAANSTATSSAKPDRILCVNASGICGGGSPASVDGVPIQTLRLSPPALPAFPTRDNRTGAASGSNGFTIIATSAANNATLVAATATTSLTHQDYLRVNAAGVVQLCNVANNNFTQAGSTKAGADPVMPASFVANSCDSRINSYCARTGDAANNYGYHCRISRLFVSDNSSAGSCISTNDAYCESLRIQNNSFFIDSSRGRIYLHFNSPWVSSAACGTSASGSVMYGTICTENSFDDGQIQHLYCPTAPADSIPCNQRALPDFSSRATIYSNANITLRIGDDGFVRDLFTYMPQGTMILAEDPNSVDNAYGVPNYRGTLWINDLWMGIRGINYQTQIAVPPFSITFEAMGIQTADNPFRLLPYYEWIVRGSSFRQVFGDT